MMPETLAAERKVQDPLAARIAGIVFGITSDRPLDAIQLQDAYADFLCNSEPEIVIHARHDGLPQVDLRDEDRVFDSEMVWSLYRVGGHHVFVLAAPTRDFSPYRIAVFDEEYLQGIVYNRALSVEQSPDGFLPSPLEFPLSEILMICLLAQGRGLMVHACGIDDGGQGYLFAGNSTHGKSTLARLWQGHARILNDDRIVLRLREGCFWMHGTPWHGDYNSVSPQGVPLDKIFFLRHAKENRTRRVVGVVASSMLLARCFPPLWAEDGMQFTLDFCAQMIETVPCYELGFVPDAEVVDFVRCVQ